MTSTSLGLVHPTGCPNYDVLGAWNVTSCLLSAGMHFWETNPHVHLKANQDYKFS